MKFFFIVYCLQEKTGVYSSYGMYNWTYIKMNQTMKQPCRNGIGNASRACILDKTNNFAMWENTDLRNCRSSSETTKKLENLLKVLLFSCCFFIPTLGAPCSNKEIILGTIHSVRMQNFLKK